jgi:hypothetical protein
MLIPNVQAKYSRMIGVDVVGKRTYAGPRRIRVGVVWLEEASGKTSVRTDSSGSRGSAREPLTKSRLMFPAAVRPHPGDIVEVSGYKMAVESTFPRYGVDGVLDHWQVDLEVWRG